MELRRINIVIIFLVMIAMSNGENKSEMINVIAKFLNKQDLPVKLTAFLCWTQANTRWLMKSVISQGMPVYVHNDVEYDETDLPDIISWEHQFYMIDTDCPHATKILQIADRDQKFIFPYRWMVLKSSDNNLSLSEYRMPVNSRVYVINKSPSNAVHEITSVYNIGNSKELITNNVARWNNTDFDYCNRMIDSKNRSNLLGEHLNVSMVILHNDTIEKLNEFRKAEKDAITKYNYILLHHVLDVVNVSASYITRDTWGYPDRITNRYNGLFGDLQSGLAEWGGFLTAERTSFSDYIAHTTPTYARFIFRKPPLSAVSNVFTLPFTTKVWYSIYILLIIIYLVVYIIVRWEWMQNVNEMKNLNSVNMLQARAADVVLMEIGAICQQGSEAEPRSGAGKIATFCIFFSLMFMYTSYSANIVALLQSTTDKFQTLPDLLHSSIELGAENTPYSKFMFKGQSGKLYQAISNKVAAPNKPENYFDAKVGVEKMRTEFFAFHTETTNAYYIVSNTYLESEKCGLKEITYWNLIPYIAIRKKSPFKELVKVGYTRLYENGLRRRNYNRFYTTKPACQNLDANFTSVSISDCYFAALSFSVGFAISLFIFIVETIVKKFKLRQFKKVMNLVQ